MKVLFAVSNEEISESIVKRYQKKYKEIISYKNVYYFNAILKELQKDKNYDRIVIGEELEAFTNTQYNQIDKFIFDKLDSISDEASNLKGEDIPIILICSDRREKSDDMLVKLFGIGVYNALIGNDRSVDNVCSLLNRPRSKKDAKVYYKIDSDDVSYQAESENDVTEVEIQNILAHYRRLGKDEKKYVDSFDNIASQYNDVQLRIISKFLPLNVRAVLEEKSTKYQQIISYNNRVSSGLRTKNATKEKTSGTSETLLNTNKEKILSKPVVIPSSMNMSGVKKMSKIQDKKVDKLKKEEEMKTPITEVEEQTPQENIEAEAPKRKRGRPRKNPVTEQKVDTDKPKRGRGRPKKNTIPEEQEKIEFPGFDEDMFSELNLDEEETSKVSNNTEQYSQKTKESEENDIFLPQAEEDNNDIFLPQVDNEENDDVFLPQVEDDSEDDDVFLPQMEDEDDDDEYFPTTDDEIFAIDSDDEQDFQKNTFGNQVQENTDNYTTNENNSIETEQKPMQNVFEDSQNIDISNLLTSDKKVACFIGTSKNGTSFIVNNLAQVTSGMGIDTAILDTTKNRNSYYIYTKNEETLRKTAMNSINNLLQGSAKGIQAGKNLTVYTSLPDETEGIENASVVLQTLLNRHSLVLIDCDFETPLEYFEKTQEIYLVQSFDILTIQPLTAFLRELKSKNVLKENKLRVILNKAVKVRGVNEKTIIGGMAYYNDPAMSFMTELFDKNTVKYTVIPFNEEVYTRYLENIINCEVSTKGYPKNIVQTINELANSVYPLAYSKTSYTPPKLEKNGFTTSMNSTLNQMRKRY